MLYNRRETWAEGGLSGDKFSQFDLHLGTHGFPSFEQNYNGHLFENNQESWSPGFSFPSRPTSPIASNWTPSTSTSDLSDQQFAGSPTLFNHWDLTFTSKF